MTRTAARALELGALDAIGGDPTAEITFLATPVRAVAEAARAALAAGPGIVTDVGSVKASIVDAVDDPRFIGGHPDGRLRAGRDRRRRSPISSRAPSGC